MIRALLGTAGINSAAVYVGSIPHSAAGATEVMVSERDLERARLLLEEDGDRPRVRPESDSGSLVSRTARWLRRWSEF
jgi:hypothetical protein